jgi:UDP-N-acetylglucosamine 4,6-dehydratase
MKRVLITGGTGTVGTAFIEKYYNKYKFYNISRNENNIAELKQNYPKVESHVGDILDLDHLINIFEKIKPDIVIHSAALKHINLAEENPTSAIKINIKGSLNVIKASVRAAVPLTIGISTDKACDPDSVYGYTKKIMEKMFMEHHNQKTKFVCTRFANVAGSNGSVIPFWISQASKGNALKLTDAGMNRLMFSKEESAELVYTAILSATKMTESFILCKIMKNVNLLSLAKSLSDKEVEIIGKRPGEKLNETLISKNELPYTNIADGFVFIHTIKQNKNLHEEHSSRNAKDMSKYELEKLIHENNI